MKATDRQVKLAGKTLNSSCHACAFFNSREEEYQLLAPFVKDGFERGDKAFHIVDSSHREERLKRLEEAGVDVDGKQESGQLEIRSWEEAYLRPGHFDKHAMLALIQEVLEEGKKGGYPLTRLWANMEWALKDLPGVKDLIEYETRLNHVLPKYDDVVVCTYDLNRFDAQTVMAVLRTHPMVIIGGILQENPFFVSPDKFLEELSQREKATV